nr:hypothetical protein [Tanacetum cinerariifolium]
MADNRAMAQMLQAPIEGYEDAIVVPPININNFELKHPEVPNTIVKLLLFPFSLEGEARIWLDKEPPRSILTWEDLVSKFINQFFPRPRQRIYATKSQIFFKNPTRLLTKPGSVLRTYFDALDSAVGGNFLDKIPRECLSIIESKSKVRYSRSRVTDVRKNANAPLSSSSHSNSFDLQQIAAALEDKLDIRMNRFEKSLNEMKNSFTPTAPLKAVTERCQGGGGWGEDSEVRKDTQDDRDSVDSDQTLSTTRFDDNVNLNEVDSERGVDEASNYTIFVHTEKQKAKEKRTRHPYWGDVGLPRIVGMLGLNFYDESSKEEKPCGDSANLD